MTRWVISALWLQYPTNPHETGSESKFYHFLAVKTVWWHSFEVWITNFSSEGRVLNLWSEPIRQARLMYSFNFAQLFMRLAQNHDLINVYVAVKKVWWHSFAVSTTNFLSEGRAVNLMEWTYTSYHPYNFNVALFFMTLAQNQDFVIVSLQKKVWWLSFELWKGQTVFVKAVVTVWNRVYYPTKFSCSLLHFQNWLTVGVVLRFFSFFRSRKKINHLWSEQI